MSTIFQKREPKEDLDKNPYFRYSVYYRVQYLHIWETWSDIFVAIQEVSFLRESSIFLSYLKLSV